MPDQLDVKALLELCEKPWVGCFESTSDEEFVNTARTALPAALAKIAELEQQLEQARSSYRDLEPCGHAKNFLIGDEHGHFICTVCQVVALRARIAWLEEWRDRAAGE